MKNILRLLVLCGVLVIWVTACQSVSVNAPTPDILSNWWSSWLDKPACKLPCWQNITPGVTTLKEARLILEKLPFIESQTKTYDSVDWRFVPNKGDGGWMGASQDGVVDSITLGGDSELLVQTIIASYGNPTYVKPHDCRDGTCPAELIYPDLGLWVSIFVENSSGDNENPKIEILPTTVSDGVVFIESGMENTKKNLSLFQDDRLTMDWKGYGNYP
jgi:hypothetical protein